MKFLFSLFAFPFLFLSGNIFAQADFQKQIQTQLILAESGDTLRLPAGKFELSKSLSMDEKSDIVITGAGMDATFLSFKNQTEGAEGIKITNCQNISLENLSVLDAKGDAIKVQETTGIVFRKVRASWTGKPSKNNGAYGLYPVQCREVLIEYCEAIGASDAGIYVGQSDKIVVRHNRAFQNVAGIEIENSTNAEVHHNLAEENTGGILVFDLPDLIKKKGGFVKVYQNTIRENNHPNFAPKGNIVGQVPAGTGIMILATSDVEIFDNQIQNHKSVGAALVSYHMTELPIKDTLYQPYPSRIFLHDNTFLRKKAFPTLKNKIGWLLLFKFWRKPPDILFDGILNPDWKGKNGAYTEEFQICIKNNGKATFADLDAENKFKNLSRDLERFDCDR